MIDWKYIRTQASDCLTLFGWAIWVICGFVGAYHILKMVGI